MNIKEELNLLLKKVKDLENKLSNRVAIQNQAPKIKVCQIQSSSVDLEGETIYSGKEINVDGVTESTINEIYKLPGSSEISEGEIVQVGQDDNSKNFFFPGGTGLILVLDKGIVGGKRVGKQVNKSYNGIVTEVEGSEQLELVAIEPDSSFHNSSPSFNTGRIYLGFVKESGGTNYYYVFLEGYGSSEKTFTLNVSATGSWTLTINTDNSGRVISASVT